MRFDRPDKTHIPQLRQLWKKAFGDTDEFLDLFFTTGFSPLRCRCIMIDEQIAAALYWFDVSWDNLHCAYIYAVATAPLYRGRGLCRALMEDTAAVLAASGYDGALLVPQDEGLRAMYGKMGYLEGPAIDEFFCPGGTPATIEEISAGEYAALRRTLLPPDAVIQEQENLAFLRGLAQVYRGNGFLAAVSRETEHLRILEFLGKREDAGSLVAALGFREATVRMPGSSTPWAMYRPLSNRCSKPEYFAFAFD